MHNLIFVAGNPFKIDKRMMVDEADIDIVGATSSTSKTGLKRPLSPTDSGGPPSPRPLPNKRKPGPIPKDVIIRRPSYSSTNTPPSSPIPWIEDMKSPAAATTVAATSTSAVDPSSSPGTICVSNTTSSSSHVSSSSNVQPSEKLVNGLAEMPTIPIFESTEHVNNHLDTPPVLTPIINNVNDAPKGEERARSERTDGTKNECGRLLPGNDCVMDNNVRVGDSAPAEERLTNHVEEKPRLERERKPTKKELEDIRQHNLTIRALVYREVRRKGRGMFSIVKVLLSFICYNGRLCRDIFLLRDSVIKKEQNVTLHRFSAKLNCSMRSGDG